VGKKVGKRKRIEGTKRGEIKDNKRSELKGDYKTGGGEEGQEEKFFDPYNKRHLFFFHPCLFLSWEKGINSGSTIVIRSVRRALNVHCCCENRSRVISLAMALREQASLLFRFQDYVLACLFN